MSAKSLSSQPAVDSTASVQDCRLGRYTEVGARTKVAESSFGDYAYVVNDSDIIYTTVGKFCSIAAHTRINPGKVNEMAQSQSIAWFEKNGKLLEAQRIKMRTEYDLEMMEEMGV